MGSNPTAVIFAICRAAAVRNPSHVAVHALLSAFGDTVAEWLRRRPAKPMCSARVGSNPIGVVVFLLLVLRLSWQARTRATGDRDNERKPETNIKRHLQGSNL